MVFIVLCICVNGVSVCCVIRLIMIIVIKIMMIRVIKDVVNNECIFVVVWVLFRVIMVNYWVSGIVCVSNNLVLLLIFVVVGEIVVSSVLRFNVGVILFNGLRVNCEFGCVIMVLFVLINILKLLFVGWMDFMFVIMLFMVILVVNMFFILLF